MATNPKVSLNFHRKHCISVQKNDYIVHTRKLLLAKKNIIWLKTAMTKERLKKPNDGFKSEAVDLALIGEEHELYAHTKLKNNPRYNEIQAILAREGILTKEELIELEIMQSMPDTPELWCLLIKIALRQLLTLQENIDFELLNVNYPGVIVLLLQLGNVAGDIFTTTRKNSTADTVKSSKIMLN